MPNPNQAPHPHLALIRAYFDALEQNASETTIAGFFTPDVQQQEFPNRLLEEGAARGLAEILEGSRKGRSVVQKQRYVIENALVDGARVALELAWTAELKVPLGKLQAGADMRATCGVFFRIRDGRIEQQHNFDCFEPF
jgi:ketosteroid isomerase-like protein